MKNRLLGGLAVGIATMAGFWAKGIFSHDWPEGIIVPLIVIALASLVLSAGVTFFFSFDRSRAGRMSSL